MAEDLAKSRFHILDLDSFLKVAADIFLKLSTIFLDNGTGFGFLDNIPSSQKIHLLSIELTFIPRIVGLKVFFEHP